MPPVCIANTIENMIMPHNSPIAIVGMACRYPDADTIQQLLENSLAQRRSFRQIPEQRLSAAYFDESGKAVDRAYARQAAVLKGFEFNREWFRVSRTSFEATDMTHWLALTVARDAIKSIRLRNINAPISNEAVRVVVGNTLTGEFSRANQLRLRWPYVRNVMAQHLRKENPELDEASLTRALRELEISYKQAFPPPNEDFLAGGLANTIAGRICNHFDFKGGGYTIDGACASSLLAVTDACSALVAGDADMVLAGGVDLSLDPFELVGFSRTAALARKEMLVYDEHSEGFWPGEGCGFVALMRYEDAVAQCEHIHAVIRGWGVSSDGRGGLTRPESAGQMLAIDRCYRRAGYGVESVGYFEGHGTGTKVGDAAELRALLDARKATGKPLQPAVISSIKANIGHTKAAAGLAGLLRATMCLSEQVLPPTTACRQPHGLLLQNPDNLTALDQAQVWQVGHSPRRASVSAMGFGGINTHITLEEAPSDVRDDAMANPRPTLAAMNATQEVELLLFATVSREDLLWTIEHLLGFAAACSRAELVDLATELARRATRGALAYWRAAVLASHPQELVQKLQSLKQSLQELAEGDSYLSPAQGIFISSARQRGRIGLLFSGQGSPVRAHGGVHARRYPQVREIYEQSQLNPLASAHDTDLAQPAIVTASLAALALLELTGIKGNVAIGHSLGELTALHWAGYFDAATLQTLAKARGKASVDDAASAGAMAALTADHAQAAAMIVDLNQVYIANHNAPDQIVISGASDQVAAVAGRLRSLGKNATLLPVRHAFHTPFMKGTAHTFGKVLQESRFSSGKSSVISTVTAARLPTELDVPGHLGRQLTAPVQFFTAASLAAQDVDLFLEVGPGQLLGNLASRFCHLPAIALDVSGNSLAPFLQAAGAAWVLDCAPHINAIFSDRFHQHFDWSWNPVFLRNPCETVASMAEPAPTEDDDNPGDTAHATSNKEARTGLNRLEQLRKIISERTGFPLWTLQDGSRMLSDLHLNSIAVGEIVAKACAARGMAAPIDMTEYANASIDEIATGLAQLEASGAGLQVAHERFPAGLDSWVRHFAIDSQTMPPAIPREGLQQGSWQGFGRIQAAEESLLRRLNSGNYGNGVIVWLGSNPEQAGLPALLQAAQQCIALAQNSPAPLHFVMVQAGWGASGFARSFFLENGSISTMVLNLSKHNDGNDLIEREILCMRAGFSEITIGTHGERGEPLLRLIKTGSETPQAALLAPHDVVLISGGGKGIGAECGFQLARRSACALLILGRTDPAENAELGHNLARMRQAGLRVSYQLADVTNALEVVKAVTKGCAELNAPVSALIHAAGVNQPCSIVNLSLSAFDATFAPKIRGLENLLAAINPQKLRLMVNFSSIIARIGLHGEADYALANEWLSHATNQFQRQYPHCRCRAIEWSVWSGTGMGQRLGRIDALLAQGIVPIPIDDGIREFLHIIDAPDLPVALIVSGRFGKLPTVRTESAPQPGWRFLQSLPIFYPEIELVADAHLSPALDPYLDDHVLDGERLFPAVMALEAMSEAALTLMCQSPDAALPIFHDVRFQKAIVVDHTEAGLTLRVIAQAQTNGEIKLALRCSSSNFQINHIEARCTLHRVPAATGAAIQPAELASLPGFDPDQTLYQGILFQRGRFKRIKDYQVLEARRCRVRFSRAPQATAWFAQDLPPTCLLGDAGVRDAALHAITACIPHKTVIPMAVERILTGQLNPAQTYQMVAQEIADNGNELIYDMQICDQQGRVVEHWHRLKLRVLANVANLNLNWPPMMASFFERQLASDFAKAGVTISIEPSTSPIRSATMDAWHRPDGKPDPKSPQMWQSSAYDGVWKLTSGAACPLGCDLQSVLHKTAKDWLQLLGQNNYSLATTIMNLTNESLDSAATRVWSAREALKKAGCAPNLPIVADPSSSARWLRLSAGDVVVFSTLSGAEDICLSVALSPG